MYSVSAFVQMVELNKCQFLVGHVMMSPASAIGWVSSPDLCGGKTLVQRMLLQVHVHVSNNLAGMFSGPLLTILSCTLMKYACHLFSMFSLYTHCFAASIVDSLLVFLC